VWIFRGEARGFHHHVVKHEEPNRDPNCALFGPEEEIKETTRPRNSGKGDKGSIDAFRPT